MTLRHALGLLGFLAMTVHSMTGEVRADPQIAAAQPPASTGKCWVYVGTYTEGASKGIYRFELDLANGNLTSGTLAAKSVNPSFLAIDPAHRFLYAVNEVATFGGKSSGAVSAFFIDPRNGNLTFLNQQPSEGSGPCHIVIDSRGKYALVANYGGGNAVVLPIQSDGRLAKSTAFVQHQGSGTNPNRQGGPHAHSINLDAANRFAFIADLGLDKIVVYKFDARLGTLVPNDSPSVAIAPGSGPRHFAFHPNGRTAYVINELQSTVTAFRYDPAHGVLKAVQTISTLPMGFTGESSTAEVQVHPSGKFLYGSNRGHDSIAIFAINPATGGLKPVGHQANQIKTPRNFGIDPTGNYMLVANQDGNSIVVFRIDLNTGELSPTGVVAEVPTPVCVKIIAQER